jgi:hypothetical protein
VAVLKLFFILQCITQEPSCLYHIESSLHIFYPLNLLCNESDKVTSSSNIKLEPALLSDSSDSLPCLIAEEIKEQV